MFCLAWVCERTIDLALAARTRIHDYDWITNDDYDDDAFQTWIG